MEKTSNVEDAPVAHSDSPPRKKTRNQSEDTSQTTSDYSATTDVHLTGAAASKNQQPTNPRSIDNQQPLISGIFKFILPSEEDCILPPEGNLEPNSAGSKSLGASGVWYKSLEESYAAQVRERSLFGHIVCPEETQKKIPESDICSILESEGVTEIGALYKVSPSKFVLVFNTKTAKEKLSNTEIQCRYGDLQISLNFHKRVGPLRILREPIFVTIFLPEYISDQAARLAFSNFGEVVSVFKGRHNFNRKIRNGKRHVRIFPAGGDPMVLPRKISFHGGIKRDVLFAEKVVGCYRCKTRHMLGENCPVVSPTPEDSSMSYSEQIETPHESSDPAHPEPSDEILSQGETQGDSFPPAEEARHETSSGEETDSDSDSESDSKSISDGDSASKSPVESAPLLKESAGLPRQESLPVTQTAQRNAEQAPPPLMGRYPIFL